MTTKVKLTIWNLPDSLALGVVKDESFELIGALPCIVIEICRGPKPVGMTCGPR